MFTNKTDYNNYMKNYMKEKREKQNLKQVNFKMYVEDKEMIDRAAAQEGISLGSWINAAIKSYQTGGVDPELKTVMNNRKLLNFLEVNNMSLAGLIQAWIDELPDDEETTIPEELIRDQIYTIYLNDIRKTLKIQKAYTNYHMEDAANDGIIIDDLIKFWRNRPEMTAAETIDYYIAHE